LKDNSVENSKRQSELFNQLFNLERDFRDTLVSTGYGKQMYFKFVHFITHDMGNILHARPYFRERQDTFSKRMSKEFKDDRPQMLYKFRINYLFADWILRQWEASADSHSTYKKQHDKLLGLFEEIKTQRRLLCENSLPLALCRAKIFWTKTGRSSKYHLQYVDLIQNSAEGLMIAIDKFTPPYKTVFRSTAIGRMTESMMTDCNATMVKLPPKEKRILYRYWIAKRRLNMENMDEILAFIRESFPDATLENLQHIISASAATQSIDFKPENGTSLAEKLPSESNPEEHLTHQEEYGKLMEGVSGLEVLERKIVVLKTGL
jgi:DNA-directed RNA polymerase specialized sigma subunit